MNEPLVTSPTLEQVLPGTEPISAITLSEVVFPNDNASTTPDPASPPAHAPETGYVLTANSIDKTFARHRQSTQILYNMSLSIKDKEFLIIHGQSGSGKTTLLNIISGLEAPSHGRIIIKGQDIYGLSSNERARFRATRFGIVYQQANWVRSLNVVQNVSLPLLSVGMNLPEAKAQAMKSLEKLQLEHLAAKDPLELSGGEQQRVGIARAIVHEPWLIIADEPTGNLDTHNSDNIMSLFSQLTVKEGRTVVMVTHNPIYEFYGSHIVEIRDGKIIKDYYNAN